MTDANTELHLPRFPADRDPHRPLDPAPVYKDWRESPELTKVLWQDQPMWAVSRHEDITFVMADPRFSAEVETQQGHIRGEDAPRFFPRMDDPEHAALRRMLTKDFTVKRVNAMRPDIEKMAHDLIDTMVAIGAPSDLVNSYGLPIPSLVISLLLGVPYTDLDKFQEYSMLVMSDDFLESEKLAARGHMFAYLLSLIDKKKAEGGDDLISRLVHEHMLPGDITPEEVAGNALVLLVAGHETTANMISLSTLTLLQNPETLSRIRDNDEPRMISAAVEELLRYLTIVHSLIVRVATEDILVGGTLVRAGEGLVMNLPAANRDPNFLDNPDGFDIDRGVRGHVAFGHGVHQCLGQTLARAELEIALPTLFRRLPNLRLAVPVEEIRFRNDMAVYGLHSMPVSW